MSSEESTQSVNNRRLSEDQVANTSLIGDSQNFLNQIIKELCDLYSKEIMKGNDDDSILHSITNYLANKQQIPEEIINLLSNQENPIIQSNPIIQNILAY
ncbi:13601_t:CDS:1, partial [Racocetra fulgida]